MRHFPWLGLVLLVLFPALVPALGTLKIDYYRYDAAYAGWGTHLWNGADASWKPTTWTSYPQFTGTDTVGGVTFGSLTFDASGLALPGAVLKFIVHNGDTKDMGGADQTWPTDGAGAPVPVVYCVQGRTTIFTDPAQAAAAAAQDLAFATVLSSTQVAVNLLGPSDGKVCLQLTGADGVAIPTTLALGAGQTAGVLTAQAPLDFAKAPFRVACGTQPAHLARATNGVIDGYLTPPDPVVLGPVYANGGVTLNFWSPLAQAVTVDFFASSSDPNTAVASSLAMTRGEGGVWFLSLPSVPLTNAYYQFSVDLGEASGPRRVLDPYAKAMGLWRQKAWAVGNIDTVGKGYLVDPDSVGPGTTPYFEGYGTNKDAIIYEASIRDFTTDPFLGSVGPSRGTYGAFQKMLPHIQNLGVTHVQLMPVLQNYYYDQGAVSTYESGTSASDVTGKNYNWGYDPHNYFTPTGMYSDNPSDPRERIREMKALVNAIHQAGMGVILDVVFNHTATASVLGDAVPGYYYRLTPTGAFTNASGCGNDVRTEGKMARKLIVDSLLYWMKEYGVDGFRFDIMGLVDTGTLAEAYRKARVLNPHVLFEGEGWQGMYNGAPADSTGTAIAGSDQAHAWTLAASQTVAGMFNDGLRSLLKGGGMSEGPGFLTGREVPFYNLFQNVQGIPYGVFSAPSPDYVMNYLTVHDNLDLYDAVANGLHLTASAADNRTALQRMRIGYTAVLTSQGTAFLYGGDEMFRSREMTGTAAANVVRDAVTGRTFVSNAYNASDALNHLPWAQVYAGDPVAAGFSNLDPTQNGAQLYQYVRGLVALRKSTDAFRRANGTLAGQVTMIPPDN